MTLPKLLDRAGPILVLLFLGALALAAPARAALFEVHQFTLSNGLQVVVLPNHRAPIVRQTIWYKAGAADELPGVSGEAHFLEHLMFRGTKTVPPGEFSRIVAENGGEDNAFTTRDYTAYYQMVAADRLELIMKLEADRMANLAIGDAVVTPEREVILEERRMRIDNNPAALFDEQINAALYQKSHYRIPTIGYEDEMHKLSSKDEDAFYRRWYAPNDAVVVIAGDVTVDQVKALAEKYFGPIPPRAIPLRPRVDEPVKTAPVRLTKRSSRVTEVEWSRQWLAPSYRTGDTSLVYPLQVLAEVLGGSAASPLYKTLVIDKGLALSASAFYDPDERDLTAFGLSATLKNGVSVPEFEKAMDAVVAKAIASGGIMPDEVSRAKQRMINALTYARDGLAGPSEIVGTALALGMTLDDVERWPDRIAAVTPDQVRQAAQAVIHNDIAVTGILMPGPNS